MESSEVEGSHSSRNKCIFSVLEAFSFLLDYGSLLDSQQTMKTLQTQQKMKTMTTTEESLRKINEEFANFQKTMEELRLLRDLAQDLKCYRRMLKLKKYD